MGPRSRCRRSRSCLYAQLQPQLRAADSSDSASGSANITSTQAPRGSPPPAPGGSGGGDPEEEEPGSGSLQIGFDAFTQQLLLAAVTGGAAAAIAFLGHVDLRSSLRLELDALSLAVELCAPVLVLLLVMCAPRWAPPFQASVQRPSCRVPQRTATNLLDTGTEAPTATCSAHPVGSASQNGGG